MRLVSILCLPPFSLFDSFGQLSGNVPFHGEEPNPWLLSKGLIIEVEISALSFTV